MAKCIKCGTEVVNIKGKNFCPTCGAIYQIADVPENFKEDVESNTPNNPVIVYEDAKRSEYDKKSTAPTLVAIIFFISYIAFGIWQITAKTPSELLAAGILSIISSIIFFFSLIFAISYSCIDKYHIKHTIPLQNEVKELKKEIELLRNQTKNK